MILRLSIELPEDDAYVAVARHMSRTLLEQLKVVNSTISDIELIIGELTSNAARHSEEANYRVDLEFHPDRAVVTVVDRGRGFSFSDVPEEGTERLDEDGQTRFGGWGLSLVRALSDRVQFWRTDPHGTTVRAEKHLNYQTDEAAQVAAGLATPEGDPSAAELDD